MTTDKNELIRYPVAVSKYYSTRIITRDDSVVGREVYVATAPNAAIAAELVRVLNLYNDKKTGPATTADDIIARMAVYPIYSQILDTIGFSYEFGQLYKLADSRCINELTSKPAPVAASGEPSEAAREETVKLLVSVVDVQVRRLAEAADKAERERDEAVSCLKDVAKHSRDSRANGIAKNFLTRLSKPSEPGNCSGVPNSSQAEAPEPATETAHEKEIRRKFRESTGGRRKGYPITELTVMDLVNQVHERDAEIARLNSVLAGVEKIIHSSSAPDVV